MTTVIMPENNKETFIEQELKKFDVTEAKLYELAEAGKGLKIANVNDKVGMKAVKDARIAIKNERVRIEKQGKSLRDQANAFNKAVLTKEKEYLAIIVPVENDLQNEEKRIADEQAKVEREIIEAKQRTTYERLNKLSAVGHVIDYNRAESFTDEQFVEELTEATELFHLEQKKIAEQKEAQRIEAERLAAENLKLLQEQARIKKQQDQIAEEQAFEKRQLELAAQKVRLEQEAVERERKQQLEHQEQLRLAGEREKQLKEQAERDRIAAVERAESNRLKAIEDERIRLEKQAADKIERERLAGIETKRQADLAPDKEKLSLLAASFDNYELPVLTMPEADKVINDVRGLLGKVSAYINQQIHKL